MSHSTSQVEQFIQQGDGLRKNGDLAGAVRAYLLAAIDEIPPAGVSLKLARCCQRLGESRQSARWLLNATDADQTFLTWQAAAQLAAGVKSEDWPRCMRSIRVAVLGSYTTTQFVPLLRLALMKIGIEAECYESHFGQYQQDILDPHSALYQFKPDVVVLATHEGELHLPAFSEEPRREVDAEVARWSGLWRTLQKRCAARIVQHGFVVPADPPLGHLSMRLPQSRYNMLQQFNLALGMAGGNEVSIVDCDRLAASYGKRRWSDPKYWYLSKQAVALDALPLLARHTAAVINADLGLSRKCLVLDLDNTLWGGVIGEDGLTGIKLGANAAGEAFVVFQERVLALKDKGIILAVCSKNNDADAREPFTKHTEMRLIMDDISIFVANWETKPQNLQTIAKRLNIGLDSLVFVDDNPVERQAVREFCPQVDVIILPIDPAGYCEALSDYLLFETSTLTAEDRQRAEQYRARAQIAEMESSATSLDDFYRGLNMQAIIKPFEPTTIPRIVQLIGKTNQFNLTTRRHSLADVQSVMSDPSRVHLTLQLRDRFADHGLVSLLIAQKRGHIMEIDTWLMSCRVIGRTVEAELLKHLTERAIQLACTEVHGIYIPSAKNAMVKDIYGRFGFELIGDDNGATTWRYDLARGPITNSFIENVSAWKESENAA